MYRKTRGAGKGEKGIMKIKQTEKKLQKQNICMSQEKLKNKQRKRHIKNTANVTKTEEDEGEEEEERKIHIK